MKTCGRFSYFLIYLSFLCNRPKLIRVSFAYLETLTYKVSHLHSYSFVGYDWCLSSLIRFLFLLFIHASPNESSLVYSASGILSWSLILRFCLQFVWKILYSSTFLFTVLMYVTSYCSLRHFSWLNALINSRDYVCGIWQYAWGWLSL